MEIYKEYKHENRNTLDIHSNVVKVNHIIYAYILDYVCIDMTINIALLHYDIISLSLIRRFFPSDFT
jgi:hypothetical protein